ncbi:WD_REPEATS_REGION domain-containing protein [Haematococcus lacustris]|uniref:WD_REPEATS_REGION domain-containing protein n=1 Tax=Haematococcus lacustris TaxID=44745 RepID=A0A699ZWX2_HAELA|nr:WD_REPEATS_REGION domain-containing protein [Haematococcus lacustris]
MTPSWIPGPAAYLWQLQTVVHHCTGAAQWGVGQDCPDVAPSGDLVLTGSCRHASPLETWDFGSGRLVTRFAFHQPKEDACMLYCAKFGTGPLEGCAISGGGGVQPCLRQHLAMGELQGQLTLASSLTGLATLFASRTVIACCTREVILLEL